MISTAPAHHSAPSRPSGLRPRTGRSDRSRGVSSHRAASRRQYRFRHFSLLSEASLKLVINGLLISTFSVALAQLLPEVWTNHQKRVAIESELQKAEQRVVELEVAFEQTFDPAAAQEIREQVGYNLDPYKRRVVLLDPQN